MPRYISLCVILSVMCLALPISAQTTGIWGRDGAAVTLSALDGSGTIGFACDGSSGGFMVSTSGGGAVGQPTWITIRTDNGIAFSVPMQRQGANGALNGVIAVSQVNMASFALARSVTITVPPSDRPAVIVDMVPDISGLLQGCVGL